jgi:kynurenine formamidase
MMATTERTGEQVGNWGRWGSDDERGALNLLTDDTVLQATRACKTGKVYRLGLPIQREGVPIVPYRGAPQRLTLVSQTDTMMQTYGAEQGVGANEDVLIMASHSITHMDALCHVFADRKHYNGFSCENFESYTGAPHCGIEKMNSFAGRGVLLDLAAHLGVDWLTPGQPVGSDDLEACRAAQGVEVRPGDILLVRTGWLDLFATLQPGEAPPYEQPGLNLDSVAFVRDHDVAAVGADNAAIECIPFDQDRFLGVHIELLVKLGIPLLEHLALTSLGRDRCYESLVCVSPLPVTGAAGSPINPIAIG